MENLNKLTNKYKAKLITTEKDYLRINSFVRKRFDYIKIEIRLHEEEKFINLIKKIIR